jgi:ubiquitin-activating enzyme E1-like protein 2
MIKNFALLGISSGANGKITVTDNDLIEKSNLNRQFLFRDHDLQKPKSSTAARAALSINKDLKIDAHLDKVGTETEDKYSNAFFHSLDVVVNALDNVQARMYVDQRCVTNQRPLLESGTLGTKGHVQVILPHLTETYASQHDPPEESFPVCTVKSFPAAIPHTVQWARGKFESLFNSKPAELQKFFEDPSAYIKSLRSTSGPKMNRLRHLVKVLENRPQTFADCVSFARIKFESYFTNLVLNLLHAFPLDTMLKDGSTLFRVSYHHSLCVSNCVGVLFHLKAYSGNFPSVLLRS